MLLAVTTGATDAAAFERLGHVFASVITGNLVLLGVSAARADGHLTLLAGCGLGGYSLGVLLTAPRRRAEDDVRAVWPASATLALRADVVFLIAFAVLWEIVDGAPGRVTEVVMLALCGLAMGIQSTAVRRLGQVSTTYLTSTLTGLLEAIVARSWTATHTRSVGILTAAFGGAAAGTLLIIYEHRWLPLLQLLPLVIVELASLRLIRAAGT
jgi:uncharacterized membrane protein YoaK (UPF0700 family)